MKKFKIGTSIIVLLVLCLFFHNLLVLINYLLALFLHEVAHLFVATRRGYALRTFRIDIFGMAIDIDSDIDNKDCFAVHIAGPIANMALYTICVVVYSVFPPIYAYLHIFATANMSLAVFNLLPIYPLDGGKIFRGMIPNQNTYVRLDRYIRAALIGVSSILLICSIFYSINWFCLLFIIFLLQTRPICTLVVKKNIDRINLYSIKSEADLYSVVSFIQNHAYSIFYLKDKCMTEDYIYQQALRHPLNTKIRDIN